MISLNFRRSQYYKCATHSGLKELKSVDGGCMCIGSRSILCCVCPRISGHRALRQVAEQPFLRTNGCGCSQDHTCSYLPTVHIRKGDDNRSNPVRFVKHIPTGTSLSASTRPYTHAHTCVHVRIRAPGVGHIFGSKHRLPGFFLVLTKFCASSASFVLWHTLTLTKL